MSDASGYMAATYPSPAPETPKGLKSHIMVDIRNRIFSGELRPGARLDQDQIGTRLRVSKIPVREALITLESAGLVVNLPRRGAYVAELTPDDIRDTFRLFGAVSAIAAQRAASTMEESEIEALRELLARMKGESEPNAFARLNERFHAQIHHKATGRVRTILRALADGIPERFFEAAHAWHAESQLEHEQMVEAIAAGDAAAAAHWTVVHFSRNGDLAVALLNDARFWEPDASSPA